MQQCARAECIACSGCLNGIGIEESLYIDFRAAAVCLGSVGTESCEYKRDLKLIDDHVDALVQVLFTGHESDLVVGDLEDVALGKAVSDLLLGLLLAAPERRTEVGIEGNKASGFFCDLKSLNGSLLNRIMRHGKCSEMEDLRALDQIAVRHDLVFREHDISAGISVEREVSVAVRKLLDKCECRVNFLVHLQAGHIDALLLGLGFKELSEHIVADLADESGLLAGFVEHSQYVAGSSAGICLKQIVALLAHAVLCKVNEKFSQCRNINFLFKAHIYPHPFFLPAGNRTVPPHFRQDLFCSFYCTLRVRIRP